MEPADRDRRVRTFKPRRRRLGSRRLDVYERLRPIYGFDDTGGSLDLRALLPRCSRVILEIGSGSGDVTIAQATERPDVGIVAIDVHRPGIARILDAIERFDWQHVRVVEGDALCFVERLPAAGVDEVWAFFPDPWPKNAQAHRRLITTERVDRLARIIRPGGALRLATDVAAYAAQMCAVLGHSESFGEPRFERPPWRPDTPFERAGRAAGRSSVDVVAERVNSPSR